MENKKPLPLGISSFRVVRKSNYLYIDKTEILLKLIRGTRYNFFARPRRFGKSLTLSTLASIFAGEKELFEGLAIAKDTSYQWPVHPVVYIDMNDVDKSTPLELEGSLRRLMDRLAFEHKVTLMFAETSGEKLASLVRALSQRGQVVILIDEYDQPITSRFPDMQTATANRTVLRDFYGKIKSLSDHIQFLFITGVSKFTKTSLFSGLNNLKDLSFDPLTAPLVGYTKEELSQNLSEYINDFAHDKTVTTTAVYNEMREWYNGYRFSRSETTVYNPWSIFNYLDSQFRANYWFESGTPTFLIQILKEGSSYSFADLESMEADKDLLDTFDVDTIPLLALLYQTGYITIKSYSEETGRYDLSYPNKEVELSLASHLLGAFLGTKVADIQNNSENLRRSLFAEDIERFAYYLQILFAGIPYSMHKQQESYYHSLLHVVFALLGQDVTSEVLTSNGRLDILIELPATIFIFELKLDKTVEKALEQIKKRRYAERYQAKNKKIIIAGINFEYETKMVTAQSEVLSDQ
jgi:hypothetical protein